MPFSETDLREIAARGARLDERLAGMVQPVGALDAPVLADRLQHWGRSLGVPEFGLPGVAGRIGQSELDPRDLAALLGRTRTMDDGNMSSSSGASWPADWPAFFGNMPSWVV